MNRTHVILLHAKAANEAAFKLETLLESDDHDNLNGIAREDVETARRELSKGGGSFCYDVPLWELIAQELDDATCVSGDVNFEHNAGRIRETIAGIRKAVAKPVRLERAEGNVSTRFFRNFSSYPDALVKEFISFILEGGRLPPGCLVEIVQGTRGGQGRGWGAVKSRAYYGKPARARGGKVFVRAPGAERDRKVFNAGGHGGYLPHKEFGSEERFFAILAHEIRHVFQGFKPIFRECRKVRRHVLGTNGKLDEVDASLFEIRALRRFRREFPRPSPAVLPLP